MPRPESNLPAILDTMIWIYGYDNTNPYFQFCRKAINCLKGGEFKGCITPQIGTEIVSATTNPRYYRTPHQPMNLEEAFKLVKDIWNLAGLNIILPTTTTIIKAIEICSNYKLKRKLWYDAFLAATMLDNTVYVLYTMNDDDFKAIPELTIINPFTEDVRIGSIELSIIS